MTYNECESIDVNTCTSCSDFTKFYYVLITEKNGNYEVGWYRDSQCTYFQQNGILYNGNFCHPSAARGNCNCFRVPTSFDVLSLTLSASPLSTKYYEKEDIFAKVSKNLTIADGKTLKGFRATSGNSFFQIYKQLSSTQYSSNLGTFNFGETYSYPPFTFRVDTKTILLPTIVPYYYAVTFSPARTISISDESSYDIYYDGESTQVVTGDQYNLDGLSLGTYFFNLSQMTLQQDPALQVGELNFQLDGSTTSSVDCKYYNGTLGIEENAYSFYYCDLISLLP